MTIDTSNPVNFNMLSVNDLLEARDHYHVHLMHKKNVVATAIGRYLIRTSDPWPQSEHPDHNASSKRAANAAKGARTLLNSEVRPYSWPCVLVFVSQWVEKDRFHSDHGYDPTDMVPSALFMPDGRVVPVCVVEAELDEQEPGPATQLHFPSSFIGGGYPLLVDVQGQEHMASVGCLLTDGHLVYALTNRHVAGEPGEQIYTILNGERVQIGVSSKRQLQRKPFQDVYPGWPGRNVYVDLDVGLVEILDKSKWTAQVYGTGTMGKLVDLSASDISLRLIECPVRAYGAASHEMYGAIRGLFYRYKAVGGYEYVADFLIGSRRSPRAKPLSTHPGDSGTVWMLDTQDERGLMPLAVQWGGHIFLDKGKSSRTSFALATCLSTVCNLLNVDIIRDWNIGLPEYWGAVGHYTIASKAISLLADGPLKEWMSKNEDLISFPTEDTTDKNMKGLSTRPFVPLADVPDMVWKVGPHKRGGMKSPEHPNHFADMDKPRPEDGKTLLELCEENPDKYDSVTEWQTYYTSVKDESRGLLPFRVWQIWNAMATAEDIATFICAAGVLAHYVGDSCQPLHISFRFNGNPVDGQDDPEGKGVHSAYEDGMVNTHIADINQGLRQSTSRGTDLPKVTTGQEAAKATVLLMQETFAAIKPSKIVDKYIELSSQKLKPRQISDALWKAFGTNTIEIMLHGSQILALIWQSAWDANPFDLGKPDELTQQSVRKLYINPDFLPSHTLNTIGPLLASGGPKAATAKSPPKAKAAQKNGHHASNGAAKKKGKKQPARA